MRGLPRLIPHRSGCADFPLPVLHGRASLAVVSMTPEFRGQMVELVRAGRSPEELANEFEPTTQSIRNRVGQAECDAGRRGAGLTTAEREELNQLRRENRQLR